MKKILSGSYGLYFTVKHKAPIRMFLKWLSAKWIADLKALAWAVISSPYIVIGMVAILLEITGQVLLKATKYMVPDWMHLPDDYRKPQSDAANEFRKYIANKEKPHDHR